MNAVNSHSNAICTLNITITPLEAAEETIASKLTLVDLAGLERIQRTSPGGARMKEGININKELFVLEHVKLDLSEAGQQGNNHLTTHQRYCYNKQTKQ